MQEFIFSFNVKLVNKNKLHNGIKNFASGTFTKLQDEDIERILEAIERAYPMQPSSIKDERGAA